MNILSYPTFFLPKDLPVAKVLMALLLQINFQLKLYPLIKTCFIILIKQISYSAAY